MSSSHLPNTSLAIDFQNVSKIYRLYGCHRDQLIDVLGLNRIGLKTKSPIKKFTALKDVSLKVHRGDRIGIIGRNGAGKTTLLKLICGNFVPTHGTVDVRGKVQALMNVGLGFHPEFTGRENIEASLQYNGIGRENYDNAIESIIEFCELGDFLDQPFKTYSLGMQARLMFASATAISPDILIVDEVLGAGDAYFIAKSKERVENLVSSGCTMLLVSHSMQQILELCNEAVWLHEGSIKMQGEALKIVKAYEEYLYGPVKSKSVLKKRVEVKEVSTSPSNKLKLLPENNEREAPVPVNLPDKVFLQEPSLQPHADTPELPQVSSPLDFNFVAAGGISRWQSEEGMKIRGFTIVTEMGITNNLILTRPAKFLISLVCEVSGHYNCRYGIVLNDHLGNNATCIYSPSDNFSLMSGDLRSIEIVLNPVQIGPGDYLLGISILEYDALEILNSTRRFDLLSRSFALKVEIPESLSCLSSSFFHTAEWKFFSSESKYEQKR